ncbi:MAG TPA: DinB family protein [Anaeromyxobacteraceae bacterium]
MSLLDTLASFPDLLDGALLDFQPELLRWAPPDWTAAPAERFTAVATVCHLRDIERDGYHVRLRRVVSEVVPDLPSVDGFELERERNYAGDSPERALADFRAARRETVQVAHGWAATDFARKATFAEYGTVTASGLLHLLSSHDLQHLSGLRWLLARASASRG